MFHSLPLRPEGRHQRLFQLLHEEQRAEHIARGGIARPGNVAHGDALLLQSLAQASLCKPRPTFKPLADQRGGGVPRP